MAGVAPEVDTKTVAPLGGCRFRDHCRGFLQGEGGEGVEATICEEDGIRFLV